MGLGFRQDFKVMHSGMDGISAGIFNSMASSLGQTLDSLTTNMNNTIDRLGMRDTWNDSVSAEIGGSIREGFESMIAACKEPACSLIVQIGSSSEALAHSLNDYLEKFESYKNLLRHRATLANNEPPKQIYDSTSKEYNTNPDWTEWRKALDLLDIEIKNMELAINSVESKCDGYISTLKNLLGPISSSSASSISASNNEIVTNLDNGNKQITNRVVNYNGLVEDTYIIYDSAGKEIGYGSIQYDTAGNKTIEEYSMVQNDGSLKVGRINYAKEQPVDYCRHIGKDGSITYTETVVARPTPNEDVAKLSTDTIGQTPPQTPAVPPTIPPVEQQTTQTQTDHKQISPTGFTQDEIRFINDHEHDNEKLRMYYNGKEIFSDDKIDIKEGESIDIIVKIPTNYGNDIELCRATADGNSTWKNGISQSNSVSPDRYDGSTSLQNQGYYVWTITGTHKGGYQVSQTAQFNTENGQYTDRKTGANGAFKEMCRLSINVM